MLGLMKEAGAHFMELRSMKLCFLFLCLFILPTLFTQCAEARRSKEPSKGSHSPEDLARPRGSIIKNTKKLKQVKHINMDTLLNPFKTLSYGVSSPFSLPPFDSLAPIPMPQNTPPFCEYPPFTPQSPSTTIPSPMINTQPPPSPSSSYFPPIFPIQSPPPSPLFNVPSPPENSPTPSPTEYTPTPPIYFPSPPEYAPSPPSYAPGPPESVPSPPENVPGPPESVPSPPENEPGPPEYEPSPPENEPSPPEYEPSPPENEPSPPSNIPSPSGHIPTPPGFLPSPTVVFEPPVVYPPPSVPPPPSRGPRSALWCVAKPSVPDPIIQEAMNYACGSGADCGSIQPDGSCYHPDTLFAHASYAFNSYWQRTKAAGGTCDFGGTGMLVTVDPSFDGCHFIYG